MRCFILLVVLIGGIPSEDAINRDLITRISPRVPTECGGKAWITFNGSQPGSCVKETRDQVVAKPCHRQGEATKPD